MSIVSVHFRHSRNYYSIRNKIRSLAILKKTYTYNISQIFPPHKSFNIFKKLKLHQNYGKTTSRYQLSLKPRFHFYLCKENFETLNIENDSLWTIELWLLLKFLSILESYENFDLRYGVRWTCNSWDELENYICENSLESRYLRL